MKKDKKKEEFIDDGRTIVNMNIPGMKGYVSEKAKKELNDPNRVVLTKAEKRAMRRALIKQMSYGLAIITLFFAIIYLVACLMFGFPWNFAF